MNIENGIHHRELFNGHEQNIFNNNEEEQGEGYYYDEGEFIDEHNNDTNINNESNNGITSQHEDALTTFEEQLTDTDFFVDDQESKRNSHLYSSTDDIGREFPIRKSSCIACALCEANANVKRKHEGGFPLRKVASCSICTWDIEEFDFEEDLCNGEDQSYNSSSDKEENEEEEEEEEEDGSLDCTDQNDGESIPLPRQRSNSYSRAMEDELSYNGLDSSALVDTSDSTFDTSLQKRLPPDGGEIEIEIDEVKPREKAFKSSSPLTKSERKKRLRTPQTSIEQKISQELDEIFGKLHRSPQQSFEDEDTFDLDFDPKGGSKRSKRGSFRKLIKTPSFLKRHKKSKLDSSKSRSVEYLYTSEPLSIDMKKSVSTMDMSTYYQDIEDEREQLDLHINEAYIEYLNSIGGSMIFSG